MKVFQRHWKTLCFALAASVVIAGGAGRALAACGDGTQDEDEACDDGNLTDGDGCDHDCTVTGCGNGIATTGEACDDGNTNNYDDCKNSCALNTCGNGTPDANEDCDDGNRLGGDGCATNCLTETDRPFNFDAAKSKSQVQLASFKLAFRLVGGQVLTTSSHADVDGNYTMVTKADGVQIQPIKVPLGFCACVRGAAVKTCGGGSQGRNCTNDASVCTGTGEGDCLFVHGAGNSTSGVIGCGPTGIKNVNSDLTRDHNLRFNDPSDDCTDAGEQLDTNPDHGACVGGAKDGLDCSPRDAAITCPGGTCLQACNGPTVFTPSGEGPPGSALLVNSLSITTLPDGGNCATEFNTKVCVGGSDPGAECTDDPEACLGGGTCQVAKGADGLPCTPDDAMQAAAATVPLTTGMASTNIFNANNTRDSFIGEGGACGDVPCDTVLNGTPFDCAKLAANPTGGAGGVSLGSAFPALDNDNGDLAVTSALASVADVDQSPTPTNTVEPTPTPTTPPSGCVGDCGDDGEVTVEELVKGVNIALGTSPLSECPVFDSDNSGDVTVDELVKGVNNALSGCA